MANSMSMSIGMGMDTATEGGHGHGKFEQPRVVDRKNGDLLALTDDLGLDNLSTCSPNDEEQADRDNDQPKHICGVATQQILALDRGDMREARSPILPDAAELAAKFKKKMCREFCLNAAATKLIFVAGPGDKGCTLSPEQLDIVHFGVEQFLAETEHDLLSAVARWLTFGETADTMDRTSRLQRDDAAWQAAKHKLPTFLKHELLAFICGETYFDLADLAKKGQARGAPRPALHRRVRGGAARREPTQRALTAAHRGAGQTRRAR